MRIRITEQIAHISGVYIITNVIFSFFVDIDIFPDVPEIGWEKLISIIRGPTRFLILGSIIGISAFLLCAFYLYLIKWRSKNTGRKLSPSYFGTVYHLVLLYNIAICLILFLLKLAAFASFASHSMLEWFLVPFLFEFCVVLIFLHIFQVKDEGPIETDALQHE